MKIVVINTAASSGGAASVLKEFHQYVVENDKENDWVFIVSKPFFKSSDRIRVEICEEPKKNWLLRLKWEIFYWSKYINSMNPDVVFSMQNMIPKGINGRTAIYLHQTIPFQNQKAFSFFKKSESKLFVYQTVIGRMIKKSLSITDHIFVQSEWLKKSLISQNCNEDIITVCKPNSIPMVREILDRDYDYSTFFYPASNEIYKNHKIILDSALKLIEEGIIKFRIEVTLTENELFIPDVLKDNIFFLGKIDREQSLRKLSESVLLFPSFIESFGLPLLESKLQSGYILASNTQFSREILDDYENKDYFDPFNSNELMLKMKNCIINKPLRKNQKSPIETDSNWSIVHRILLGTERGKNET